MRPRLRRVLNAFEDHASYLTRRPREMKADDLKPGCFYKIKLEAGGTDIAVFERIEPVPGQNGQNFAVMARVSGSGTETARVLTRNVTEEVTADESFIVLWDALARGDVPSVVTKAEDGRWKVSVPEPDWESSKVVYADRFFPSEREARSFAE